MFVDNLADCQIGNKGCDETFESPDAKDHRDRVNMCRACRDVVKAAILGVLRCDDDATRIQLQNKMLDKKHPVKCSTGYLLSPRVNPQWVEVFLTHVRNVDDKFWKSWWRSNVIGDDRYFTGCNTFFKSLLALYKAQKKKREKAMQGAKAPIHIPDEVAKAVAPTTPEPTPEPSETPPAEEPTPAETKPEPKPEEPKEKARASSATQDAPAPKKRKKGAGVKITKAKKLDPVEAAQKKAEEEISKAEKGS